MRNAEKNPTELVTIHDRMIKDILELIWSGTCGIYPRLQIFRIKDRKLGGMEAVRRLNRTEPH